MSRTPRIKPAKVGTAGSKVHQPLKGAGHPAHGHNTPGRVFLDSPTDNIFSKRIMAHMEENPDLFTPELIISYKETQSL